MFVVCCASTGAANTERLQGLQWRPAQDYSPLTATVFRITCWLKVAVGQLACVAQQRSICVTGHYVSNSVENWQKVLFERPESESFVWHLPVGPKIVLLCVHQEFSMHVSCFPVCFITLKLLNLKKRKKEMKVKGKRPLFWHWYFLGKL